MLLPMLAGLSQKKRKETLQLGWAVKRANMISDFLRLWCGRKRRPRGKWWKQSLLSEARWRKKSPPIFFRHHKKDNYSAIFRLLAFSTRGAFKLSGNAQLGGTRTQLKVELFAVTEHNTKICRKPRRAFLSRYVIIFMCVTKQRRLVAVSYAIALRNHS